MENNVPGGGSKPLREGDETGVSRCAVGRRSGPGGTRPDQRTKLFSAAPTSYGAPPNTQVALFDAAMPGTLPVLNRECVIAGVKVAKALNCELNVVSTFDRKHYFYADLPAGYQITQQRHPLARGGRLPYVVYSPGAGLPRGLPREVRISQVQLEHDSGKTLHELTNRLSLVDLNRAGVALVEIITRPELHGGEDAAAFVKELAYILRLIGACDGKMEEGSLRVDANVSVSEDPRKLGSRTEVKNLNSIRSVVKAIEFEVGRQIKILTEGGEIEHETLAFDAEKGITFLMRDKEQKADYRFMPEPNLPPLRLHTADTAGADQSQAVVVDHVTASLPAHWPEDQRRMLVQEFGLSIGQAATIAVLNR